MQSINYQSKDKLLLRYLRRYTEGKIPLTKEQEITFYSFLYKIKGITPTDTYLRQKELYENLRSKTEEELEVKRMIINSLIQLCAEKGVEIPLSIQFYLS